jgi:hypothetical protein
MCVEKDKDQAEILFQVHKALVRLLADVGDERSELLSHREEEEEEGVDG